MSISSPKEKKETIQNKVSFMKKHEKKKEWKVGQVVK